jgi:hypothetical protein
MHPQHSVEIKRTASVQNFANLAEKKSHQNVLRFSTRERRSMCQNYVAREFFDRLQGKIRFFREPDDRRFKPSENEVPTDAKTC